jgi:thiosulfate/3-mercaptopyruvate sulfurtransferase
MPNLPLILEPDVLETHLTDPNLRIVDLCRFDIYARQHVPGAVHLEYGRIIRNTPPVMGLLPDEDTLSGILSVAGITPSTHVVAYDDEGGGKASRFLWTLDCIGHRQFSLLNGGLHAWAGEGHRMESTPVSIATGNYAAHYGETAVCDRNYILAHLRDPELRLLDCRTPAEYSGAIRRAERAGHIPGAVNVDWVMAMDQQRNLRLRPQDQLRTLLEKNGVTPEREVIVYCHTHHRSAHTYIVLKSLGYDRLKGYAGSWSDWGNRLDTPVETG